MEGSPIVRVLMVGDSGVGKTTLLRRLCPDTAAKDPGWTVGANLGTTVVGLGAGDSGSSLFVDVLDIGGHERFKLSRSVFYHKIHGVMLVYDASNRKSYQNLRRWMAELAAHSWVRGNQEKERRDQRRRDKERRDKRGAGGEGLAGRDRHVPEDRCISDPAIGRQAYAMFERERVQRKFDSLRGEFRHDPAVPFLVPADASAAGAPAAESGSPFDSLRHLPVVVVGTKADRISASAAQRHGPSRPFRTTQPVDALEHYLTHQRESVVPAWFVAFAGRVAAARFATAGAIAPSSMRGDADAGRVACRKPAFATFSDLGATEGAGAADTWIGDGDAFADDHADNMA